MLCAHVVSVSAFASSLSKARVATVLIAAAISVSGAVVPARTAEPEATSHSERLDAIISNHTCPCGCGNPLPLGDRAPACFGCSVGKSEVSFIRENLAAGRSTLDIVIALSQPALIEVFADYTDPQLGSTWNRVRRIAAEFGQHRVVVRAPAETVEARRALEFAECARQLHRFSAVRDTLVAYIGPWDREALLSLAENHGLAREATRQCLANVDVAAQIAKDRQHARERQIREFPAVSVNRTIVRDSEEEIRSKIQKILLEESL
jgi:hypothetical protein